MLLVPEMYCNLISATQLMTDGCTISGKDNASEDDPVRVSAAVSGRQKAQHSRQWKQDKNCY